MTYQPHSDPYGGFCKIVRDFVQAKDQNRRLLADAFEVAPGTIDRWWMGTVYPHPLIQSQVIAWIKERL